MPGEALSFRRGTAEDAAALGALTAEAGLPDWSRDDLVREAERPESEIWIAERESTQGRRPRSEFTSPLTGPDRIEGFGLAWVVLDEACILLLVVRREARRKGVGRALLGHVERAVFARGALSIHLDVAAGNEAARALYERAGFEQIGVRKGYYQDGSDAILMVLGR